MNITPLTRFMAQVTEATRVKAAADAAAYAVGAAVTHDEHVFESAEQYRLYKAKLAELLAQ